MKNCTLFWKQNPKLKKNLNKSLKEIWTKYQGDKELFILKSKELFQDEIIAGRLSIELSIDYLEKNIKKDSLKIDSTYLNDLLSDIIKFQDQSIEIPLIKVISERNSGVTFNSKNFIERLTQTLNQDAWSYVEHLFFKYCVFDVDSYQSPVVLSNSIIKLKNLLFKNIVDFLNYNINTNIFDKSVSSANIQIYQKTMLDMWNKINKIPQFKGRRSLIPVISFYLLNNFDSCLNYFNNGIIHIDPVSFGNINSNQNKYLFSIHINNKHTIYTDNLNEIASSKLFSNILKDIWSNIPIDEFHYLDSNDLNNIAKHMRQDLKGDIQSLTVDSFIEKLQSKNFYDKLGKKGKFSGYVLSNIICNFLTRSKANFERNLKNGAMKLGRESAEYASLFNLGLQIVDYIKSTSSALYLENEKEGLTILSENRTRKIKQHIADNLDQGFEEIVKYHKEMINPNILPTLIGRGMNSLEVRDYLKILFNNSITNEGYDLLSKEPIVVSDFIGLFIVEANNFLSLDDYDYQDEENPTFSDRLKKKREYVKITDILSSLNRTGRRKILDLSNNQQPTSIQFIGAENFDENSAIYKEKNKDYIYNLKPELLSQEYSHIAFNKDIKLFNGKVIDVVRATRQELATIAINNSFLYNYLTNGLMANQHSCLSDKSRIITDIVDILGFAETDNEKLRNLWIQQKISHYNYLYKIVLSDFRKLIIYNYLHNYNNLLGLEDGLSLAELILKLRKYSLLDIINKFRTLDFDIIYDSVYNYNIDPSNINKKIDFTSQLHYKSKQKTPIKTNGKFEFNEGMYAYFSLVEKYKKQLNDNSSDMYLQDLSWDKIQLNINNDLVLDYLKFAHESFFKQILTLPVPNNVFDKFLTASRELKKILTKLPRLYNLFNLKNILKPEEKRKQLLNCLRKLSQKNKTWGDFIRIQNEDLTKDNLVKEDEILVSNSVLHMLDKYFYLSNIFSDADKFVLENVEEYHDGGSHITIDLINEYISNSSDNPVFKQFVAAENTFLGSAVKRNNISTASYMPQNISSYYGVSKTTKAAIIDHFTNDLHTYFGDSTKFDVADGSVATLGIAAFWERFSHLGTLGDFVNKPFGGLITKTGTQLIKCASFPLDNLCLINAHRNSNHTGIKLKSLAKRMMSVAKLRFNEDFFYNAKIFSPTINVRKNGKIYNLTSIIANKESNTYQFTWENIDMDSEEIQESDIIIEDIKIENVYDLWLSLGAEYSLDQYGNYTNNSMELASYLISMIWPEAKSQIISKIIDSTAVKSSTININLQKIVQDDSKELMTYDFLNHFYGPQTSYEEEAQDSILKGLTQLFSNVNLNGEDLETCNILQDSIEALQLKKIEEIGMKETRAAHVREAKRLMKIAESQAFTLSNVILILLDVISGKLDRIPLSHPSIYRFFSESLILNLNSKILRQIYQGIAVILLPSNGVFAVYEDAFGNVYEAADLINVAYNKGYTGNDDGAIDWVFENIDSFLDQLAVATDFNIGDEYKLEGGETKLIKTPQDLYELEDLIKENKDILLYKSFKHSRDLKPPMITFFEKDSMNKVNFWFAECTKNRYYAQDQELAKSFQLACLKGLGEKESPYYYKTLDDFLSNKKTYVYNVVSIPGELIMPNIYNEEFNTNGASLAKIKAKGAGYFVRNIRNKVKLSNIGLIPKNNFFTIVRDSDEINFILTVDLKLFDSISSEEILEEIQDNGSKKSIYINDANLERFEIPNGSKVTKKLLSNNKYIYKIFLPLEFKLDLTLEQLNKILDCVDSINDINVIYPNISKLEKVDKSTSRFIVNVVKNNNTFSVNNEFLLTESYEGKLEDSYLEQGASIMYSSFTRSLNCITVRIPTQNFLSFMATKTVGFTGKNANHGYINVWSAWFTGGDYDVDKSFTLFQSINKNGRHYSISSLLKKENDYLKYEYANIYLPIPNKNKTIKISSKGTDIDKIDFIKFIKSTLGIQYSYESAKSLLVNLHDYIYSSNTISNERYKQAINILSNIINALEENNDYQINLLEKDVDLSKIIRLINNHANTIINASALQNRIVTILHYKSKDLKNFEASLEPMAVDVLKKIINDESVSSLVLYIKDNPLAKLGIQEDASVGKLDVGINANALKSTAVLLLYYNNKYNNIEIYTTDKLIKKLSEINGETNIIQLTEENLINLKNNYFGESYTIENIENDHSTYLEIIEKIVKDLNKMNRVFYVEESNDPVIKLIVLDINDKQKESYSTNQDKEDDIKQYSLNLDLEFNFTGKNGQEQIKRSIYKLGDVKLDLDVTKDFIKFKYLYGTDLETLLSSFPKEARLFTNQNSTERILFDKIKNTLFSGIPYDERDSFIAFLYFMDKKRYSVSSSLSALISFAVDNMKELQLYKINAFPKLCGFVDSLFVLGFPPEEAIKIAVHILGPIAKKMNVNRIIENPIYLELAINKSQFDDKTKQSMLKVLLFSNDITSLSLQLKVNLGVKGNIIEFYNFLDLLKKGISKQYNEPGRKNIYEASILFDDNKESREKNRSNFLNTSMKYKDKSFIINIALVIFDNPTFNGMHMGLYKQLNGFTLVVGKNNFFKYVQNQGELDLQVAEMVWDTYVLKDILKNLKQFNITEESIKSTFPAFRGHIESQADNVLTFNYINNVNTFVKLIEQQVIPSLKERFVGNLFFDLLDQTGSARTKASTYNINLDIFDKDKIGDRRGVDIATADLIDVGLRPTGLKTSDGRSINVISIMLLYDMIVHRSRKSALNSCVVLAALKLMPELTHFIEEIYNKNDIMVLQSFKDLDQQKKHFQKIDALYSDLYDTYKNVKQDKNIEMYSKYLKTPPVNKTIGEMKKYLNLLYDTVELKRIDDLRWTITCTSGDITVVEEIPINMVDDENIDLVQIQELKQHYGSIEQKFATERIRRNIQNSKEFSNSDEIFESIFETSNSSVNYLSFIKSIIKDLKLNDLNLKVNTIHYVNNPLDFKSVSSYIRHYSQSSVLYLSDTIKIGQDNETSKNLELELLRNLLQFKLEQNQVQKSKTEQQEKFQNNETFLKSVIQLALDFSQNSINRIELLNDLIKNDTSNGLSDDLKKKLISNYISFESLNDITLDYLETLISVESIYQDYLILDPSPNLDAYYYNVENTVFLMNASEFNKGWIYTINEEKNPDEEYLYVGRISGNDVFLNTNFDSLKVVFKSVDDLAKLKKLPYIAFGENYKTQPFVVSDKLGEKIINTYTLMNGDILLNKKKEGFVIIERVTSCDENSLIVCNTSGKISRIPLSKVMDEYTVVKLDNYEVDSIVEVKSHDLMKRYFGAIVEGYNCLLKGVNKSYKIIRKIYDSVNKTYFLDIETTNGNERKSLDDIEIVPINLGVFKSIDFELKQFKSDSKIYDIQSQTISFPFNGVNRVISVNVQDAKNFYNFLLSGYNEAFGDPFVDDIYIRSNQDNDTLVKILLKNTDGTYECYVKNSNEFRSKIQKYSIEDLVDFTHYSRNENAEYNKYLNLSNNEVIVEKDSINDKDQFMIDFLQKRFNLPVKFVTTNDFNASVLDNAILINDRSNISQLAFHELTHLIVANLRLNDPELYIYLKEYITNLSKTILSMEPGEREEYKKIYEIILSVNNDNLYVNIDKIEEIFVRLVDLYVNIDNIKTNSPANLQMISIFKKGFNSLFFGLNGVILRDLTSLNDTFSDSIMDSLMKSYERIDIKSLQLNESLKHILEDINYKCE